MLRMMKNTDIEDLKQGKDLRNLQGVRSNITYQKASAICYIKEENISDDLRGLGGLKAVAGDSVTVGEGYYFVKAPIVIMDDKGFDEYCEQIGIEREKGGSIVLNRIWDSVNSNFRYKEYVPFLKEEQNSVVLQNAEHTESVVEIPVLAYTKEVPILREEYDNYSLVQFIPLSVWNQISAQIGNAEADTYIRILGEERENLTKLNELQSKISQILQPEYMVEIENRIQEKITDDNMRNGAMLIWGAFCFLLAVIGIANVFSNTLGFIRQRKREFARYISVGMTPEGMRKMFCIEALVIAGRPILITLPLTAVIVGFMITASYLNPQEFLVKAPVIPIVLFMLAIFGFVVLAYYIGGKRILKCNLADALQNDSME